MRPTVAILLITLFAVLLSLPFVHIPDGIDKIAHAAIFFLGMTGVIRFAGRNTPARLPLRHGMGIALLLAAIGLQYEVVQAIFIPGRTGDFADWYADLTGIAAALAYYRSAFGKHRLSGNG